VEKKKEKKKERERSWSQTYITSPFFLGEKPCRLRAGIIQQRKEKKKKEGILFTLSSSDWS